MTVPLLLEHFDQLISTPEDVEKLNRSILQLAMQGKLASQNSEDESVHVLFKRIQEEKNNNNGKRSTNSLPAISEDEIPFSIPSSWIWTRLGDISNYGESKKTKSIEFTDDTWVLDLEDIEKTTSRLIQKVRLKDRKFNSEKNVFQKGDVIYGKLRPYLDKVVVADEDGICSSELIPIQGYAGINPFYLRWALKRPDFIDYVNSKTYGVKMPRLGTKDACMALVPLPPLAEQQRIGARVEELFAQTRLLAEQLAHSQIELDRLNESALAHLLTSETPEEFNERWCFIAEHFDLLTSAPEHIAPLRQSILELAVRGKLTRPELGDQPVDFPKSKESENLFDLPNGWSWFKMREIGKITGGITKNGQRNSLPLKMPYLRVANVYANELRLDDVSEIGVEPSEVERTLLEDGDLLVVEGNGSIEQIGRVAIWRGQVPSCLHQNHIIKVRFEEKKLVEFILYWLLSPSGRKRITNSAISTTGLHTLSLTKVSALDIPLPPLAEQERIVKRVEQLLGWCDALEAQLKSAEEERGWLVESVLAGVGGSDGE